MALWLWNEPFFDNSRPSRLLDQHFGSVLESEDLVAPLMPREFRNFLHSPAGYLRPWSESQRDVGSTVSFDEGKFQANLDVQQFKPEEITVKVADNTITVEGKHEEKRDEHGYISRHFVRRYVVPKGRDVGKIESKLSSDGVLTITAPRTSDGVEETRNVPIQQTGRPSESVEQKKDK